MRRALVWETATERILDRVDVAPGASCLDAGCGPGETVRRLARRVGVDGTVTGLDVDAALGTLAEATLHESGYRQCRFRAAEITGDAPVPGRPTTSSTPGCSCSTCHSGYPVLRRLWDAVAPGGHLVVQDYDLRAVEVVPSVDSFDEVMRVIVGAFDALGCDIRAGIRLPQLFAQAGVGAPDGSEVAGRVEPLATGCAMPEQVFRSVLPVAIARGITDERRAGEALAALRRDAARFPTHSIVWPLMLGAWARKR